MRLFSNKNLAICCAGAAFVVLSAAGVLDTRTILLASGGLSVAAVIFAVRARLGRHPEPGDTERFLIQQLVSRGYGGAFRLANPRSQAQRMAMPSQFVVRFSADVTITEPLYRLVNLTPDMTGRFTPRRISVLGAIARKIVEELGRDAEGVIKRMPANPFEYRLIEAASEQGRVFALRGVARVKWTRYGWRYSLEAMSEGWDRLLDTGLPRGGHGQALVLNSTDGQVWFRDTMRAWHAFEDELAELQRSAEAKRMQRAHATRAAFFSAIRPGMVFFGLGETLTQQAAPTPCFLEVTLVEATTASVGFLLRNDSGWGRARPFSGTVAPDCAGETVILQAQTRAVDAQPGAGPLLQAPVAFDMEVRWTATGSSQLVCTSGDFVLKLDLLAPEEVLLRRAEVYPREAMVRAATATGMSYTGFVRSVSGMESVTLDFQLNQETQHVVATFACAGGQARFAVEQSTGRYTNESCDLLLLPAVDGVETSETQAEASGSPPWGLVKLSVQGSDLEGWTDVAGASAAVKLRRLRQRRT